MTSKVHLEAAMASEATMALEATMAVRGNTNIYTRVIKVACFKSEVKLDL